MSNSEDFEVRFEHRLRGFAALAATRPDPEVVARAVGARSNSVVNRLERAPRPAMRPVFVRWRLLLLAAILVLGALATALVAGGLPIGHVVAPTPSPSATPPASPSPTAIASQSLAWPVQFGDAPCPGGTSLAALRDATLPGATGPRWVAAPAPVNDLQGPRAGKIAVSASAPDGASRVYLVDPSSGAACLLVELPRGVQVGEMRWSPAGDALAIAGVAGNVYVWSRTGATEAYATSPYATIAWSPNGAWLALGDYEPSASSGDASALWALPANGLAVRFGCELKPGLAPSAKPFCPVGPQMLWAPDSQRIAIGGGDRTGLFGVASLADPTFRRLAVYPALEEANTLPLAWLDGQTLLAVDQSDTLLQIPVGNPSSYRIKAKGILGALSPTLDRDAWISADGLTLSVRNLARDTDTIQFSAIPGNDATKIDNVVWAPDGKSLAFTLSDSSGRPTLQVIGADGSGLKTLLVGSFRTGDPFAGSPWQPIWP